VRVVLDTNVLVAGLRSKNGAAFQLLQLIGKNRFDLVISTPLVLEYEDVLLRPELGVPSTIVAPLLDFICLIGVPQPIYYLWRPFLRDVKDDMVLELAFNARAELVTFNAKDFRTVSQLGVQVITPLTLLERMQT
jgi:putative PIN family toxin of toxin-antitoxin system